MVSPPQAIHSRRLCEDARETGPAMTMEETGTIAAAAFRLQRRIDFARDHVRGGSTTEGVVSVVLYGDYLCPHCRGLGPVLDRLRQALGARLAYVFRHFP